MTGQADCPQCGAVVVTHASHCFSCGYVPGSVDGWRPLASEVLHADGPVRITIDAQDRIRVGTDVDLELRDVVIWDFDGQRVEGPKVLELKPGLGPEITFRGRKASRFWADARLRAQGPAVLSLFERP